MRALCAVLFWAVALVSLERPALATPHRPSSGSLGDEGGETGLCTVWAESESARAPLFVIHRATLSQCDDRQLELVRPPAKAPHRVDQQVTPQELRAVLPGSMLPDPICEVLLLVWHDGLGDADEHRPRAPRPPRSV